MTNPTTIKVSTKFAYYQLYPNYSLALLKNAYTSYQYNANLKQIHNRWQRAKNPKTVFDRWSNRLLFLRRNVRPSFKGNMRTFQTIDGRWYVVGKGRTFLWCLKRKLQMLCKGQAVIGGDIDSAQAFFSDNGRYKTYPDIQILEQFSTAEINQVHRKQIAKGKPCPFDKRVCKLCQSS